MKRSARTDALVVWGGWNGHTPRACAERFAGWLRGRGFRTVVSDSLDIYCAKRTMRRFRVIVPIWTMGEITREQWSGLRDAVLDGAGIAGWHGGLCDAFRMNVDYQFMTGGQWVAHPGGIIRYKVCITRPDHAIVRGLKDFRMKSEQYYMHVDPANTVLATTTFSGRHGNVPWIRGSRVPAVWTKRYGQGRVFFTSVGHVDEDFDVPEAFEIAKRGILWAARKRVVPEYTSDERKTTQD